MKRTFIYGILAVFVTATILFTACTKDQSEVRLAPKLSTSQFLNVKSDSATVIGFVVAEGVGFTERGICFGTSPAPTVSNTKVAYTGTLKSATYTVKLGGLTYATKYYARAYATGLEGTVYGEEVTFTTLPIPPILSTAAVTVITGKSATGGGNVTGAGGAEVTARGICFGTSHNPTITDNKTSDAKGLGAFVSSLTNLMGNTTYYVRAYATNSAGTGYGPEVSFLTLVDLPVVTTTAVTGLTKVSAISGGDVTYDGGGTITARGLVWSLNANPTIAGSIIPVGSGKGVFVGTITGLTLFTTYHVRAFATNSVGTTYGADVPFTTLADITKFWVVGGHNGWSNNDSAPFIISTPTSGGAAEGYINIPTDGELKLTTDHSWDDAHTFGNNGSGKLTNPGGNIAVKAGYYLIKANISTMTYSLTKTTWGIIGNATPGNWNSDTPMSYDAVAGVWILYSTLSKQTPPNDGLKFRGNSDWAYNYGDDGANGSLEAGGTNIGVSSSGDYSIVLDLSHPNAYTYSLTTWGLIGDATPGSWNTDTPMSWDAVNKVWTVTVALVSGSGSKTFKFRANQGWDLNYGGKGSGDGNADNYSDATTAPLAPGGKNLGLPGNVDGTYKVTFDPKTLKATLKKI